MAEGAKVDDGVRSRPRKAFKRLRKDREEEKAARELQEEMQRNVEEAQERVLESKENLFRELKEYMYSRQNERRRAPHLGTKIWQMIQSNNTKCGSLENDFTGEHTFAGMERNHEFDQSLG